MMGVIAILASNKEAGEDYAQELGLMTEYKVITEAKDLEDLVVKALVVTPGHVEEYMAKYDYDWNLYFELVELANSNRSPLG